MSFLYTKLPDKLLGKLGKIWWELWPNFNFWANFIKFLPSYGPLLGASICWGHSVLQTLAPFFFSFFFFVPAAWRSSISYQQMAVFGACLFMTHLSRVNVEVMMTPWGPEHYGFLWFAVAITHLECRTLFFKRSFKNQLHTKELSKTGWRSLKFYQICYKPLV